MFLSPTGVGRVSVITPPRSEILPHTGTQLLSTPVSHHGLKSGRAVPYAARCAIRIALLQCTHLALQSTLANAPALAGSPYSVGNLRYLGRLSTYSVPEVRQIRCQTPASAD